jgi:hypothetical protein
MNINNFTNINAEAILIIGMHRSGTSCLAGTLQQYGLFLGQVHEKNPHNLKGNRENNEIMLLNDAVLAYCGGSWDRPPSKIAWSVNHAKSRDIIIAEFEKSTYTVWGFKDPRTLLTLPFWMDGLSNPCFVGTYRHPMHVVISLYTRGKMPYTKGLQLWRDYNNRLLSLFSSQPFPLISFDLPDDKYIRYVDYLAKSLGLHRHDKTFQERFFDPKLRHNMQKDADIELPEEIINIYKKLNSFSEAYFARLERK